MVKAIILFRLHIINLHDRLRAFAQRQKLPRQRASSLRINARGRPRVGIELLQQSKNFVILPHIGIILKPFLLRRNLRRRLLSCLGRNLAPLFILPEQQRVCR